MIVRISWSAWCNMAQPRCACVLLLLLLTSSVLTLPTQPSTTPNATSSNASDNAITGSGTDSNNQTTPHQQTTVTYIVGEPIKNGTVQSPAELLSPDRYEFYTFDDDGQIIKKLMSVEEIQRILASSKGGISSQNHHSGDYYQVLSVTPDVESLPAVRINPNEPLFSIHDVITSVQNVLKAEMKHKMTPPPSTLVIDGFQNAHLIPEGEDPPKLPPLSDVPPSKLIVEQKIAVASNGSSSANVFESETKESLQQPNEQVSPLVTDKATTTRAAITTTTTTTTTTAAPNTTKKDTTLLPSTKKPTSITKKPSVNSAIKKGDIVKTTLISKPAVTTPSIVKFASTITTENPAILTTQSAKLQSSSTISSTTSKDISTVEPLIDENKVGETLSHLISTEYPTTMVQILRVTSSVSQHTSPNSQIPTVTTQKAETTSYNLSTQEQLTANLVSSTAKQPSSLNNIPTTTEEYATTERVISDGEIPEVLGLSLLDAHPGLTSNSSFLNENSPFAIESFLFDKIGQESNSSGVNSNLTAAESALSQVQLPINEDLAESVSSVISQIAHEISLSNAINLDETVSTTFPPTITTSASEVTEEPFELVTTELPVGWLKNAQDLTLVGENDTESTTTEEIPLEATTTLTPSFDINPQNKPRPFSKIGELTENIQNENATTDPTTTAIPAESRTDLSESLETVTEYTTTIATLLETTTILEIKTESEMPANKNTAGQLKLAENFDNLNGSIEIIQEAETGRIPRPTQQPDEITSRPGSLSTSDKTGPHRLVSTTTNLIAAGSSYEPTTSVPITKIFPSATKSTIVQTTKETIPELSVIEGNPLEANSLDEAENISISFVPMAIRSTTSTPPKSPPSDIEVEDLKSPVKIEDLKLPVEIEDLKSPVEIEDLKSPVEIEDLKSPVEIEDLKSPVEIEGLKSPESEDVIESKIAPDEEGEKSDSLDTSHKVIIAALSDKKSPLVVAIPKEPFGSKTTGELKQNFARPQTYVKPQKPVFIKPTKSKPQVDSKPSKPIRPSSSEEEQRPYDVPLLSSPSALELDQAPAENLGLEATTVHLENDVREFVDLCNELAFTLWSSITHNGLSFVRSVVISPFAVTSLLAMVFLGARGPTSGQMNDILKLDDVVTFNPHLVFRNVTESLVIARNPGISTAAFVRELYSDRTKGKLLDFYKERAQQFYDGHVEEVNFKAIGETLRRQTNHLVKRQTWGKVKDFLQGSTLMLRPPLAAFSANIFQADCSRASTRDRDGEMYFVVLPSNRLRRLVPVPAIVWRDDFLAGYEPNLDATVAAVGGPGSIVTTIFVMPGQQGLIAPGDSLARLEHHLLGASFQRGHWGRLLRSLLRRPGLELQVPRLSHKSVVNVTASLQKMGLRDLFNAEKADLTGLNGLANDLHLSDMVQVNMFSTCGDEGPHHTEFYPATPLQRRDKSADNVFAESIESLFAVSDFEDPTISSLPLELRPRQARIPSARLEARTPDPPRLRLDRPFLFFVRHNPTGLILHVGRFNPRLMH